MRIFVKYFDKVELFYDCNKGFINKPYMCVPF